MSNPLPPPDAAYPRPGEGGSPAQGRGGHAPGQGGYPEPGQGQAPYPGPTTGQFGQGQAAYGPDTQSGYPAAGQPNYAAPGQGQPGYPDATAAQWGNPASAQNQSQYPAPGQAPYAAPGQAPYAAPGQAPYSAPGAAQPGFPPPPATGQQPFGAFPGETKNKGGSRRIITRIGLSVLALIVVGGVRFALAGDDEAKEAKAGDCIAANKDVSKDETTEADAKVVDCGSSEAKFTVVARVDGETDTESKACDKNFKEGEEFYVFSSTAGGGYLLCLRPNA